MSSQACQLENHYIASCELQVASCVNEAGYTYFQLTFTQTLFATENTETTEIFFFEDFFSLRHRGTKIINLI